MKKITKAFTAIQIGTALSPLLALTQAQADRVDDVQTKANEAGVSLTVEDKPAERVASKVEADKKNQLAEEQLRTDLSKVSSELDQYIHTRDAVTKENEALELQYQKDVHAEEQRVRAEQARVEKENADKLAQYETEKAQVEKENAEKLAQYEAEKAKVEKENAEKLAQYETEKAQVEKENAEKLAQYEAEKAKVEKENAEKLAQYEVEKVKVEKENAEKLSQYEAEKAKVLALRDQLTRDYEAKKAQVEAENAQLSQTAKDADKTYQDALKAYETQLATLKQEYETKLADYNAQLVQITKFNQEVDASNAKANADYEAKKAQIEAANQTTLKNYQDALAVYEQGTTVTKEKVLDMDIKAPEGVTVNPKRVIEKDLTGSTNLEADLKAAEDEFKKEEASVRAQLDTHTKSLPAPVDSSIQKLVNEQRAKIDQLLKAQNNVGEYANIRYVLKPKSMPGATKDSLEAAYAQIVKQLEAEKLTVTKHDEPAYEGTPAYSYYQVESKDQFLNTWSSLIASGKRAPFEAVGEASRRGQTVENVPLDITKVSGYQEASETHSPVGTEVNPSVKAWQTNAFQQLTSQMRQLSTSNASGATLTPGSPEYAKAVDAYNQNVANLESDVTDYNEALRNRIQDLVGMDITQTLAQSRNGLINGHTLKFSKSSDRVTYLNTPSFDNSTQAYPFGFDVYNPELHETEDKDPHIAMLGNVQYTMVRIPKGESITVRYRRSDGQAYLSSSQRDTRSRFVSSKLYAQQDSFTNKDAQDVTQLEYTITNDGSATDGGDLVAFITNDISAPVYYGVSTQSHPYGTHNLTAIGDHGELLKTTQTLKFLNDDGEVLMPVVPQLKYQYPDKTNPSTLTVDSDGTLVKGNLPQFASEKPKEWVAAGSTSSDADYDATHGTVSERLRPVEQVPELESDWKDKRSWMSQKVGWTNDAMTVMRSSYNKPQLDSTVAPVRQRITYMETGKLIQSTDVSITQPTKPTFGPTYKIPQFTGELMRTIEFPMVQSELPQVPPITPVKMVIKYKEVKRGEKPTPPTVVELPKAPEMKEHRPLPVKPEPTPAPKKPTKPAVDGTPKPLPKEPGLPSVPQKPVGKPLPEKPQLSEVPSKPKTPELPTKPETKVVPKPLAPTPTPERPETNTRVVEKKVIPKPQPKELPKKPEFHIVREHYVYQPKTIWETVDGKVLRNWEDGEKPKDGFNGYEYVRTDKDKDGNIHHIYKPVEKPQEQPKVKTIWETVDGKVLRNWEDGEKPKDSFDGYEYVKTVTDKDGNIHHIYQPVKKVTTIWVTVDGKVLRARKDGTLPKDSFDGYEYVRTDVDKDGNTTHVFKPVKKVTTIWVTVDGKVLRERTDGTLPKDSFDGYEFVETRVDEDGNTTHIFKPVVKTIKTIWQTVDKTITLREWQDGELPKDSFDGYEYVTTEIDEDGNIHHLYKPVVKEAPKKPDVQPQTAKELPKTGDTGMLTSVFGGLLAGTGLFGFKRKKNRKK